MLENLPNAVGHALRGVRAGLDHTAFNQLRLRSAMASIDLRSLAFADHAPLPERYTADGEGLSPPLNWGGIPSNATSLLLLVEDADAPAPHPLVHAIVVDLPPEDGAFAEGAIDDLAGGDLAIGRDAERGDGEGEGEGKDKHERCRTGRNSFLSNRWLPPDPPPGHGTHRYVFQMFALGGTQTFSNTPGREEVLAALQASAIASGCLIGTYGRPDGSVRDGKTITSTAEWVPQGGLTASA